MRDLYPPPPKRIERARLAATRGYSQTDLDSTEPSTQQTPAARPLTARSSQRPPSVAGGSGSNTPTFPTFHMGATTRIPSGNNAMRPTASTRMRRQMTAATGSPSAVAMSSAAAAATSERSLRRYHSAGISRSNSPAPVAAPANDTPSAAVKAVGRRELGIAGRQQSETGGTRRLRNTPSQTELRAHALQGPSKRASATPTPPQSYLSRHNNIGSGSGSGNRVPSRTSTPSRNGRTTSPVSSFRFNVQREPSPTRAPTASVRRSRIPTMPGGGRDNLYHQHMELKEKIREQESTNKQLIDDIKSMISLNEGLESKLQAATSDLDTAKERACQAEDALLAQHTLEKALRNKIAALEDMLMCVQNSSNGLPSPHRSQSAQTEDRESPIPADDWREDATLIRREIESIHASCTMAQPESQMDRESCKGLRFVEQKFLNRDLPDSSQDSPMRSKQSSRSPKALTPQQQRRLGNEDLVARRRSTMLFEGLIQPSLGTSSHESLAAPLQESSSVQGTCLRCRQLEDTLQTVVIDNDYYREANGKLKDSVHEVVSRHNALVRLFEQERQRRRDARAERLAEESRVAAHDRAIIEAHQRAEIEDSDGLAGEFSRGLNISSPKRARATGDARLVSAPITSPALR